MPLVKAEKLDEEQHGIVFGQTVAGAPLGDRLLEFVIEIARFCCANGKSFTWSGRARATFIPWSQSRANRRQPWTTNSTGRSPAYSVRRML
jgi:hypothetical protein